MLQLGQLERLCEQPQAVYDWTGCLTAELSSRVVAMMLSVLCLLVLCSTAGGQRVETSSIDSNSGNELATDRDSRCKLYSDSNYWAHVGAHWL
jgi:hypothetical protein